MAIELMANERLIILTDELSNPGCLINLSLTSNREPFTQHLSSHYNLLTLYQKNIEANTNKTPPKGKGELRKNRRRYLPHDIRSIICVNFTQSCVGLKVLCILQKNISDFNQVQAWKRTWKYETNHLAKKENEYSWKSILYTFESI